VSWGKGSTPSTRRAQAQQRSRIVPPAYFLECNWTDEGVEEDCQNANPNTVVVIKSRSPVTMQWIDKATSVIHACYGGNETGNAGADVIFGDANAMGRP